LYTPWTRLCQWPISIRW